MFKNMKLSTKQIGGFVIISFIIAIVGVVGINGLKVTGKAFDICMDVEIPIADASMEGMIALISGRDLMGEFLLSEDTAALDKVEKEFQKTVADFDQHAGYIAKNASTELKNLVDTADKYHSVFQENAVELMKHQRLHIVAEQKADLLMKDYDQDADELKELLGNYEEELTRNKKIDKKVDAAMEAKTFMVEQKAITEEYMGVESLIITEKLRNDFKKKEAEFDSLEKFLPSEVIKKHEDFSTLSFKIFDQHDESLRMKVVTGKHMALVDEFSEKADLTMDRVEEASAKNMESAMVNADTAQSKANFLIIVITLAGFISGIVLGLFISRSISKPLNLIIEGMGDGANQVASASNQVSTASQSLAEGASEQAAAIEETSSSLEEMSSMTKQNADNAGQADNLMKEANQVVGQANHSMGELTTSMEEISKASEETSKIIKTIDEIAFQTNLLALNAAVEAARAGEAGAGFAVVADEVRNLAMRAAEAAKNTADLIEGTVKKVNDGSDLVTKTNDAFKQVAESSRKVGELVGEIAAASDEQAQGIEQVNKAVTEMDKVVQQNAASAEESASASEEMNAQAVQMKNMVGELDSLVSGAGNENTRQTTDSRGVARHQKQNVMPVQKIQNKQMEASKPNEVNPEKVIPMDDDFTDF